MHSEQSRFQGDHCTARGVIAETDRLILRVPRVGDLTGLHRVHSDPRVTRYITGRVGTAEDVRRFIERTQALHAELGMALWLVERKSDRRVIGDCGLKPIRWSKERSGAGAGDPPIELGYHFAHEAWGRGYATEAARAALGVAESTGACATEDVIAVTDVRNDASGRVLEKVGFRAAGETRDYYDETTKLFVRK